MSGEFPNEWLGASLDALLVRMSNGANVQQFSEPVGLPISRIETIWNETIDLQRVKYIREDGPEFIDNYRLHDGDILFSHINSDIHLGKTAVFQRQTECLIHGINLLLLRPSSLLSSRFLNYQFKHLRNRGAFVSVAQRAVNQSSINQKKLKAFRILVPPLNEQKRIADKLDTVLGAVGRVKDRLDKAEALLKRFRQSVLNAATTGKLTEEWRAAQGIEDEWDEKKGEEIFEKVTSGSRGWAKFYSDEGALFLRIGNLNKDSIKLDLSSIQHINLPEGVEGTRTRLQINDILISITADIGMVGLVDEQISEAYINQHICLARHKGDVMHKFLALYLSAGNGGLKQLKSIQRGAVKAGLTLGDIRALKILIPIKKEQQEIVLRVERLFAAADRIEERLGQTRKRVERLESALLAKAFRGELVPQDPSDEPASELLKRIKAERAEKEQQAKPRRRKRAG